MTTENLLQWIMGIIASVGLVSIGVMLKLAISTLKDIRHDLQTHMTRSEHFMGRTEVELSHVKEEISRHSRYIERVGSGIVA